MVTGDAALPGLLDVSQVADLLGIAEYRVKDLVRCGDLVGVRPIPKRLKFRPEDVEDFIQRKRTVKETAP